MSAAPQFIGPRAPLVDPRTGTLTREGLLFLQALWSRCAQVDALRAELQALKERVDALEAP